MAAPALAESLRSSLTLTLVTLLSPLSTVFPLSPPRADDYDGVSYPRAAIGYDPYGEKFETNYFVTPWTLSVVSSSSIHVGLRVFVDGKVVHESHLPPHSARPVTGVQSHPGHPSGALSELLWARPCLPKPERDEYGELKKKAPLSDQQLRDLCSLRCEFFEITQSVSSKNKGDLRGASTVLQGLDKSTAKSKGMSVGSQSGHLLKAASSHRSKSTFKILNDRKIGEITVRYRQRYVGNERRNSILGEVEKYIILTLLPRLSLALFFHRSGTISSLGGFSGPSTMTSRRCSTKWCLRTAAAAAAAAARGCPNASTKRGGAREEAAPRRRSARSFELSRVACGVS